MSDMVQKVSGVLGAGTIETHGSSDMCGAALVSKDYSIPLVGSATNHVDSRSQLARELAPPNEPEKSPILDPVVMVGVGGGVLIGLLCACYGIVTWSALGVQALTSGIVLIVVVAGVVPIRAAAQKKYNEQHAAWSYDMDVWNKLYYCQRDDGVFLPGYPLVPAHDVEKVYGD
jgi:hypothetical protein